MGNSSSTSYTRICQVCSSLEFSYDLDATYAPNEYRPYSLNSAVTLGPLSEVRRRTDCALCRLVTAILEKDRNLKDAEDPRGECFLRPATGTYRTYIDRRDVCDVFYGGHPTSPIRGHIIVQQPLTGQPHPEPRPASSLEDIDFQQVRRWLKACEDGHAATCDHRPAQDGYRAAVRITLIDTEAHRLVESSTSCRFLTLSYVWGEKVAKFDMGKSNAGNFARRHEPGALRSEVHALPKAIQDAWKVTQELGERFLWVDALCIQQDDPDELKRQLPLMDRIYNQSVLTIVAVSGRHADEPLPGVRPGHRTAIQPVELAAPWVFTGEMPSLDWVLGLTRYEKRAWTLQERLLCKRRLFLSDWQVYFQCYQVVWQECYPQPRQIVQNPNSIELLGGDSAFFNFSYAKLGGFSLLHVRHLQPWDGNTLQRHDLLVSELCRREVGEEDNILNAFAGMVSYLESLGTGPIEAGTPLPIIDRALLWAPVSRLKKRPISNEEGLPSWSWVAWHGHVRHIWNHHGPVHEFLGYDFRNLSSDVCEFFIERNGKLERIERNAHAEDPSRGLPPVITAEEYGMQPVKFLRQPVLHFLAYTVPAAAFNFRGGRIRRSDFDGDWSFTMAVPSYLAVASMHNHSAGVFLNIQRNFSGEHSIIFCQTEQDAGPDPGPSEENDEEYPATWILDHTGRRCGILLDHEEKTSVADTEIEQILAFNEQGEMVGVALDYEDPTTDRFRGSRFSLVLLSKSSTLSTPRGVSRREQKLNSRGQRVMLKSLAPPEGNWAITNLLLVKCHDEGPFVTRVGIAHIFVQAWEEAGPEMKYLRLA
ncbi:hypothetical protein DL766_000529 [Monosporascus sp. MC13-8B]|uniref:Heterokaryon incompatibility domain-containing protein n=1 Tax=Monosporascus cannonballus TaxID=155416 RepID=A0ABY0GY04_9PEZI|nr:hypothetical protein DL762_007869 [Monosporascus cannonballus]RYO82800.1 hypothetical protein DL763_008114 [Monosporascus cannonballus]RYP39159.1 hypothetical protein DL766_000529 [Monosporascus sp. MC13-8B]